MLAERLSIAMSVVGIRYSTSDAILLSADISRFQRCTAHFLRGDSTFEGRMLIVISIALRVVSRVVVKMR